MRHLTAALLCCAAPSIVMAHDDAWESWTVENTVYAGICSEHADETCVVISCADGAPSLSLILIGAWAITKGDKEDLFLSIGGGEAETVSGTKQDAPGFGPEFYAITGTITTAQLGQLQTHAAFAVGPQSGGFAALPLTGSRAAIDAACR